MSFVTSTPPSSQFPNDYSDGSTSTSTNTFNPYSNNTDIAVTIAAIKQPNLPLPFGSQDNLVNAYGRDITRAALGCGVMQIVTIIGIPGNVLNLIVFAKQGLRDRINVLLFSLAVADLGNLLCQFITKISCYLAIRDTLDSANWEVLIMPSVTMTGHMINLISGLLIVVVAVDRCFSVAFPLKAAHILSFRRMLAVILFVYIGIFACYVPSFMRFTLRWRTLPITNRTMVYITVDDPAFSLEAEAVIVALSTFVKPSAVVIVFICSVITVVMLKRAARTRGQMQESQSQVSQTETKVTRLLLVLCVIFVVCVIPDAGGALATFIEPGFGIYQKYHNTFGVVYNVFYVLSAVNSTFNFFAYLALSSKYRATLSKLLPCCGFCLSRLSRRKAATSDSSANKGDYKKNFSVKNSSSVADTRVSREDSTEVPACY